MAFPSIQELTNCLKVLQIKEPASTAEQLLQDLLRMGMTDFSIGQTYDFPDGPVIEYKFGKGAYSIENADPKDAPHFFPTAYGGTQLDSENLLYLMAVMEVARDKIPTLWAAPTADFKGKFCSPRQHLDTLNEIWWLSAWQEPTTIKPNHVCRPGGRDIDWRLRWDYGLTQTIVNLEVKRRVTDVERIVGKDFDVAKILESGVIGENGSDHKFITSQEDEINVLAVTLLVDINRDVQEQVKKWVLSQEMVDAVLLYSRGSGLDPHVRCKSIFLEEVIYSNLEDKYVFHGRIAWPLPYAFAKRLA